MKLLPSQKRTAIYTVVTHHPEWSAVAVMGNLVMDPEYRSTVERMVNSRKQQ